MRSNCFDSKLHSFEKRGHCFVFNPATCTQHIIEPELYQKYINELSSDGSCHSIRDLVDKLPGMIPPGASKEPLKPSVHPNISHVSIFVTDQCNLNCSYCYVNKSKIKFGVSFVEDLILFLKSLEAPVISLNFTGGEPLIYPKIIKSIVERCLNAISNKRLIFSLNTNAILVTHELAQWLASNHFLVMVSLDGDIDHELNPSDKRGKNNYEKILTGVEHLRNAGIEPSARATLIPSSIKLIDLYEHLLDCKFKQAFIGIPSFQVCHDKCVDQEVSMKEFQEVLSDYEEIYIEELRRYRTGEPTLLVSASQYLKKRTKGVELHYYSCGAMLNSIAIAVDGNVYPCQRFVGNREFIIGTARDNLNETRIKSLLDQYDGVTEQCGKCWARNLCGRGCFWEFADSCFHQKSPDSCNRRRLAIETIIYLKKIINDEVLRNARLISKP